ncbi:sphingosine/diacylglycerol kinase-like enzyme [Beggiatoa alba B18LD]|uniref:Sphingosine/diacylglycerol kinase-like enzyme n=1 Tax=Beggiatoa alba B18LD TaxID=395493 RepID=I3CGG1_9GAMM|nr:diacylglycerol kinase family protein [Beggiatoa alba]EIJ42704.1 sphingosine/diacylglycerol kinase-like enzyme [Beggiatoa alba B18LD]
MKTAIIINRYAGSMLGKSPIDQAKKLHRWAHAAGLNARIFVIKPKWLKTILTRLINADFERIIVGGGDGTLNTAVNLLAGTSIIFGVLPLGTFNQFARELGIPLDIEQALLVLAKAEAQSIDVGEINGHLFLNKSSIGIHPRAIEIREQYRRRWGWSKAVAVSIALFKTVWRPPKLRLKITSDKQQQIIVTPFLLVGNNSYESEFLAFPKRIALNDGLLSVLYTHRISRFTLLKMAIQALFGKPLKQVPELANITTSDFYVESRRTYLKLAVDGEVYKMKPPLHFKIHHRRLRVLIPSL